MSLINSTTNSLETESAVFGSKESTPDQIANSNQWSEKMNDGIKSAEEQKDPEFHDAMVSLFSYLAEKQNSEQSSGQTDGNDPEQSENSGQGGKSYRSMLELVPRADAPTPDFDAVKQLYEFTADEPSRLNSDQDQEMIRRLGEIHSVLERKMSQLMSQASEINAEAIPGVQPETPVATKESADVADARDAVDMAYDYASTAEVETTAKPAETPNNFQTESDFDNVKKEAEADLGYSKIDTDWSKLSPAQRDSVGKALNEIDEIFANGSTITYGKAVEQIHKAGEDPAKSIDIQTR